MMLNTCTKFQENISMGFRVIEQIYVVCLLKFAKVHNSVKNVGGIMVLFLFPLSNNALYVYQFLPKYLIGFQNNGPEQ